MRAACPLIVDVNIGIQVCGPQYPQGVGNEAGGCDLVFAEGDEDVVQHYGVKCKDYA